MSDNRCIRAILLDQNTVLPSSYRCYKRDQEEGGYLYMIRATSEGAFTECEVDRNQLPHGIYTQVCPGNWWYGVFAFEDADPSAADRAVPWWDEDPRLFLGHGSQTIMSSEDINRRFPGIPHHNISDTEVGSYILFYPDTPRQEGINA